MTKERLNGLQLFLLGSIVFVLLGSALLYTSPDPMGDFKASYYSARCLIQHRDPYKKSEISRVYDAEGGAQPAALITTRHVYPPTAFSFTVPFAMFPWGAAHILWFALTTVGLILASFLVWDLGANYAPTLSGALVGFLLANCLALILLGNPSGIAISLCVTAVWCFLRERFIPVGVVCLAFSLAIKPQDAAFIWLLFFLAGGVYRKRALQTLVATVALSLPVVLWVWSVSPHWWQELHSNMLELFVPGGIDYPGLAASGPRGLVNLQEIVSVFSDNPHVYNSLSYLVTASLLLPWIFVTLRSCRSPKRVFLALAAIVPLSLLPVYHHFYDTKLLLLTVPACGILWAEGGLIGWLALLVNTAGFVLTADIPWTIAFILINYLHLPTTGQAGKMLMALQAFPVPLILLIMGIFYLSVYMRHEDIVTSTRRYTDAEAGPTVAR